MSQPADQLTQQELLAYHLGAAKGALKFASDNPDLPPAQLQGLYDLLNPVERALVAAVDAGRPTA